MSDNTNTSAVVTIRYVVMSILNQLQEYSMKDYKYLAQLVIEGYTDINLWTLGTVNVVYVSMDPDSKILNFPSDMVDYYKIGYINNGRVYNLTLNDDLALPRATSCGHTLNDFNAGNINFGYYYTDHYYNGTYNNKLFGLGGGLNDSYYRIDKERNCILFSNNLPSKDFVIEYKSTGVSLTSQTLIPRQAVKTLQNYVHWQRIEHDVRVGANQKDRKQNLYLQELEKLRDFEYTPTMQEYLDSLYEDIKQVPKR